MENRVYVAAHAELTAIYGRLQPLVSGNGARKATSRKGRITIYHNEIAAGNAAEIAFHAPSMAAALGKTEREVLGFLSQLSVMTGRPVLPNPTHLWSRVGLASMQNVQQVFPQLRRFLDGE